MISVNIIPIPGSLVKQQSNEHMTGIAPAPASEDKENVIRVSALLAHTHTNRAPRGEMNTEWRSHSKQRVGCR